MRVRLSGHAGTRPPSSSLAVLLDRPEVLGYLLLLPALGFLTVFIAYPFGSAVWLSLTDRSISAPDARFIGVLNFTDQLRSQIFVQTIVNTVLYTGITVWLKLVLGLSLALLMNQSFRLKNVARAALLLPWIVPTALSALAWLWLFDSTYSVFNRLLVHTGVTERGVNWLGEPLWAMASIITANIWRGTPFFAISILSALQTVDRELYAAAAVDGANRVQTFRHVTLPLIRPVLLIVVLFSAIWTVSDFQLVYVLTRGGPTNSTHLLGTLAYDTAVRAGQLSEGAAVALYMFPVLVVCAVALLVHLRRT